MQALSTGYLVSMVIVSIMVAGALGSTGSRR